MRVKTVIWESIQTLYSLGPTYLLFTLLPLFLYSSASQANCPTSHSFLRYVARTVGPQYLMFVERLCERSLQGHLSWGRCLGAQRATLHPQKLPPNMVPCAICGVVGASRSRIRSPQEGWSGLRVRGAGLRAPPGGPQCCWMCFSAACCVLGSDLPRGSLGPGPDTRGPRRGARPPCTSGRSPGSAPAAPPPSPNFLPTSRPAPLGAPLCFPHELFSSVRSNQRAPAPTLSPGWGRGDLPRLPPRAPLPPRPGAARPSPSPAQPRPARPRAAVSLPPAPFPLRSHPPGRRGAHSAPRREQHRSREGGRPRAAGPPPASRGGTPRPRRDPRLQPRLALRPPGAASVKTLPARPRARRGRGATPGRRRRVPVPGAPAWAHAEGPDRESRAGSRRLPSQGGFRPGGAGAPQTRIGSNPRETAPWNSGLCFAGLRSPPP